MSSSRLLLSMLLSFWCVTESQSAAINNRPIIGILTQPCDPDANNETLGVECVGGKYVRFAEMGGARVVPVRSLRPKEYFEEIFKKINGLIIPGGRVKMDFGPYHQAAKYMYQLAVEANDAGDYFPIWGVCWGMQILFNLREDEVNVTMRTRTGSYNKTLPLTFEEGYRKSRLFGDIPQELVDYLSTEPLAQHNHNYSILVETARNYSRINDFFRIITTNIYPEGVYFASSVEAYNYPFYGLQWHPEKSVFLFRTDQVINHSDHAIRAAQYLAAFLVREARKSSHHYESTEDEARAVIENDDHEWVVDPEQQEIYYFSD